MTTLVDRGVLVTSSRQWTTALSTNAAGDGFNYIAVSGATGSSQLETVVLKNFTTAPTQQIYDTPIHHYPNSNFSYLNQLRAPNGRIFFPLLDIYTNYYDPITEAIVQIGPVVETPPVSPNVATQFYSASFDVAGQLYFGTQESQHRPSCIVRTDPTTTPPTQTVLGYVGSASNAYSTYGYYLAPDTITAQKYIYVSYGQDPWQLWALNITTGIAAKLAEVTATGRVTFVNIAGQGWVANVDTDLGHPDNVRTQYWCLDGALYPYTAGQPPPVGAPATRNVTPASTPVPGAPQLDTAGGIGIVGYRFGTSGSYTYENYTVQFSAPVAIECLVTSPRGVTGETVQYLGFVDYDQDTNTSTWHGAEPTGTGGVAQPLALYVPTVSPAAIFFAGYPDGVTINYNPAQPWQTSPAFVNPAYVGAYGTSGTLAAGIKYVGNPDTPTTVGASGNLVWSPSAGASGRLYCAGTRDRSGTGAGIGYYDKATGVFRGTYAAPLTTVRPQGLVDLPTHGQIAMSTIKLSGVGPAPLYLYDYNLVDASVPASTQFPLDASIANLGPIFATSNPDIICGAYITGGVLALYRWNVATQAMIQQVTTAFAGVIDCASVNTADGSVWLAVGNAIVRVDPNTLAAVNEIDVTTIAPIPTMAFHGTTLYLASGANLWSADISSSLVMAAGSGTIEWSGGVATFSIGTARVLAAASGKIYFSPAAADIVIGSLSMVAEPGTIDIIGGTATFQQKIFINFVPGYRIVPNGGDAAIVRKP